MTIQTLFAPRNETFIKAAAVGMLANAGKVEKDIEINKVLRRKRLFMFSALVLCWQSHKVGAIRIACSASTKGRSFSCTCNLDLQNFYGPFGFRVRS